MPFWTLPRPLKLAVDELHRRTAAVVNSADAVTERRRRIAEPSNRRFHGPADMYRVIPPWGVSDGNVWGGVTDEGGYQIIAEHEDDTGGHIVEVLRECYCAALERLRPELDERLRAAEVEVEVVMRLPLFEDPSIPFREVYEAERDPVDSEAWTDLATRAGIERDTALFDALVFCYGGPSYLNADHAIKRERFRLTWNGEETAAGELVRRACSDFSDFVMDKPTERRADSESLLARFSGKRPVWTRVPRLEMRLYDGAYEDDE